MSKEAQVAIAVIGGGLLLLVALLVIANYFRFH